MFSIMFKYLLSFETRVRKLLLPNSNAESDITGIRSKHINFVFRVMSVFVTSFFVRWNLLLDFGCFLINKLLFNHAIVQCSSSPSMDSSGPVNRSTGPSNSFLKL